MRYDMTIQGGVTGAMWWPTGVRAGRSFSISARDMDSLDARMDSPSLRELLLHVLSDEGGDYQGAEFTSDAVLTVRGVARTREWPLTAFPSVRDLIAVDTFAGDFVGEE